MSFKSYFTIAIMHACIVRSISISPLVLAISLPSFFRDPIFLSTPARLQLIFFHSRECAPFLSPCPFFWCRKRRTYTRGEPPISVIWMGNGLTLEVGPPVNDGPGRDPADEMMRAIPPSPAGPCDAFSLRPDRDWETFSMRPRSADNIERASFEK